MLFTIFFLLAATCVVPGASQDLSCVMADSNNGPEVVWSIGIAPTSGINAKYFGTNPSYDLCYADGNIYTAGPSSTLLGVTATNGGHIAKIAMTGSPQIVASFTSPCTAIGCDESLSLLIFAIQGDGIKSTDYSGTTITNHAQIVGSYIRNIFVDSSTTTCYFVDMAASSMNKVYSLDYTLDQLTLIGQAGVGAVGCVLDYVDPQPHLSILYDNCDIERCPLPGPLQCGNVLQVSSGSCLAMSGTGGSIFTHDDTNTLYEIDILSQVVYATSSSATNVVGMDCFISSPSAPPTDPCDPNPCLNGGVCTGNTVSGVYTCACVDGYTGINCEIPPDDGDECEPDPCLNGGTCLDLVSAYECECLSGLGGQNCEEGDPELLAILENLENFGIILGNNTNFANLNDFYADDTIIDFLDYPQYRGKEGHAQLAAREKPLFRTKVPTNLEVRRICDLCFEVRFKMQEFYVDAELGVRYVRVFQVWCFNFDSLLWEVKSLAVTPDPDPRL